MKYFAYGSNMSQKRLQKRVRSATKIGRYYLNRHKLCFHKASEDGSAKCDALFTNDSSDIIIGALFEMDESERIYLDRAEGLGKGYDEKYVQVSCDDGTYVNALIYVATSINKSLQPYSWYLNHVIIGAIETGLPENYISGLKQISSIDDPDLSRDLIEQQIYFGVS